MTSPNLIFIVLDTLREDRVLSIKQNMNLTPFIQELTKNSIIFKNCISNYTWTLPSHISMFTGLFSTQNALISKNFGVVSNRTPILAETLKDLGYNTMYYSENAFISKRHGLNRGFEVGIDNWKSNLVKLIYSHIISIQYSRMINFFEKRIIYKTNIAKILRIWKHIKFRTDRLIFKLIRKFFWKNCLLKYENNTLNKLNKLKELLLARNKQGPVFLYFNIMATHYPYIPSIKIFKEFDFSIKCLKKLKVFLFSPYVNVRDGINVNSRVINSKKIEMINNLYNMSVFYCDSILKKIFSILSELELLDNCYVIITSDHGEHLFGPRDHNLWEHSTFQSVYNGVIKVPMLIFNKQYNKQIIKEQVQLKDLFHTFLHLTGIESPKNKYLMLQNSILSQIQNKTTPKYIFGEYIKNNSENSNIIKAALKSYNEKLITKRRLIKIYNNIYFLRANDSTYVKYGNKFEELFDLLNDPYEQKNLFEESHPISKKMRIITENMIKYNNNIEELKDLLTKKEKESVKRILNNIKIKGI